MDTGELATGGDNRSDGPVLLAIIWLAGALVRLFPLLLFSNVTGRPFGMGGLYLLFAREIAHHGFTLPTWIPLYTAQGLPFAYPPLAFYIEALLRHGLGLPPFVVTNFLPALFSIGTIGVFYRLARVLLASERQALLATAIYALMPAAFLEHLPGEGLVEGLGTLLFIGGIVALMRLNRRPAWPETAVAGLLIALNLLASPGGAYGLALSAGLLWLLPPGGRRAPLWRLLAAGGIGLLLSAPYWLTVALRHGPGIFWGTFARQHGHLAVWLLAKMGFIVEQQLPLSPWGVLALIGLAASLAGRDYSLPLWCVAVYMIPREFAYLVAVPLALLAARGLYDVILPGAARWLEQRARSRAAASGVLLFVLLAWGIVRAFAWAMTLPEEADLVTVEEQAAMAWIATHTSPEATFVVIGDEVEWFPLLTERTTYNVIWGSEWSADDTVFRLAEELEACRSAGCYLETAAAYDRVPDYLYISRTEERSCLIAQALEQAGLELAWENEGAVLLRVVDFAPPGGL